jgi:hypothetical protein
MSGCVFVKLSCPSLDLGLQLRERFVTSSLVCLRNGGSLSFIEPQRWPTIYTMRLFALWATAYTYYDNYTND